MGCRAAFVFLLVDSVLCKIEIVENDFGPEEVERRLEPKILDKILPDSSSSFIQRVSSVALSAVRDEEYGWETISPKCLASQWSAWSPCSSTCGPPGSKTRTRMVEPAGCVEDVHEESCKPKACPVDCEWDEWGTWGQCSQECYGGHMTRTRGYKQMASVADETHLGGEQCCGNATESQPCGATQEDCEMVQWSDWTSCSTTCNTGTQRRTRHVSQFPKCGGHPCIGALLEIQNCEVQECTQDCEHSKWTEWTACPAECGGATQTRRRNVTSIPAAGGNDCEHGVESRNCAMKPCMADCVMSKWTDWSTCSSSCQGIHFRSRTVLIHPDSGGMPCDVAFETKPCNEICRLDCEVGEWETWGACSATCGGGAYGRTRPMLQEPANGGEHCGEIQEVKECSCLPCPDDLPFNSSGANATFHGGAAGDHHHEHVEGGAAGDHHHEHVEGSATGDHHHEHVEGGAAGDNASKEAPEASAVSSPSQEPPAGSSTNDELSEESTEPTPAPGE